MNLEFSELQVFGMDDLKAVWAQGNKLEVIPGAIGCLRLLTQLRLFKNKIRFRLLIHPVLILFLLIVCCCILLIIFCCVSLNRQMATA